MNNEFKLIEVLQMPQANLPIHAIYWEINVFSKKRLKLKSIFYNTNDLSLIHNHKPVNAIYCFNNLFNKTVKDAEK